MCVCDRVGQVLTAVTRSRSSAEALIRQPVFARVGKEKTTTQKEKQKNRYSSSFRLTADQSLRFSGTVTKTYQFSLTTVGLFGLPVNYQSARPVTQFCRNGHKNLPVFSDNSWIVRPSCELSIGETSHSVLQKRSQKLTSFL